MRPRPGTTRIDGGMRIQRQTRSSSRAVEGDPQKDVERPQDLPFLQGVPMERVTVFPRFE